MKKLLSLPPNLVHCFHDIEEVSHEEYFCTSDPVGRKLGSGGGTTWLLEAAYQAEKELVTFQQWISREKRVLLHAGGQSRRLPGYAPSGKVLTPIPLFRWARGQRINQNLLNLQLPLYEHILEEAPEGLHTLIASGDVYIRAGQLQPIPDADVVCYGLWVNPSLAKNHGVFVSSRQTPSVLDYMLQKPSVETLGQLMRTHLFLMDVGIWLLSDRAVELLMKRSYERAGNLAQPDRSKGDHIGCYDLYSEFGCALGEHPLIQDEELRQLKVAILPLQDGQFYHYGTSREMISSTVAIQNIIHDQRSIMHYGVKPHPSIFIQNTHLGITLTGENQNVWIENSWMGEGWRLSTRNIITGIPRSNMEISLREGVCIDVVPIGDSDFVVRPYGFNDAFRGALSDPSTTYLERPVTEWLKARGINPAEIEGNDDLQSARIFPVCHSVAEIEEAIHWMIAEPLELMPCADGKYPYREVLSANEISDLANLRRLSQQRDAFRAENLVTLAGNHHKSVFYQSDLSHMAAEYVRHDLALPQPLEPTEPLLKRINDSMFRAQVLSLRGEDARAYEQDAFALLRDGLTQHVLDNRQQPVLDVYSDQIVWGRSPVRIDIAGGWTDTPPFCLTSGGSVVNFAIELNGQQPLQAYVKPCKEFRIILRSIDLGAAEEVRTFDELADFAKVGSPFSIPKAALCLAGFHPRFALQPQTTLQRQLEAFGSGIEVTLLSAIPAGSGLGTSSILASTVLGAVSDFCGLGWDNQEIANRTLVLEQLLTTGGGWQDQYGGVLRGVKLLRTQPGFDQTPEVRWLPDNLFTDPEYAPCHLLYYTGITRTAKKILAEIVRGMFLSEGKRLQILESMKEHSMEVYNAIQTGNFEAMGQLIRKTWTQNQLLDSGTNPLAVSQISDRIDDLCLGYKLPGAGGGGYLYMVAKDPEAASRIRQILNGHPRSSSNARFVDMRISKTGFQVSRS